MGKFIVVEYGLLFEDSYFDEFNFCSKALSLQMPFDGSGAYSIILAKSYDPDTGAIEYSVGSQPHLWGTKSANPSYQGPLQWDDRNEDYEHTAPTECYTYSYGLCVDPIGAAVAFWADEPTCYVDCNGDTIVNSTDFLCYLNLFVAGDPAADCNGDTLVDSTDFLCFLNLFADPPCP